MSETHPTKILKFDKAGGRWYVLVGNMRPSRPYWMIRFAGLLALAGAAGCCEELGPVQWETTRVTGVVREGGRPVVGGWIEFLPIEGTVGTLRSAPISAGGHFEVTGVPVGRHQIGLVGAPIGLPGGRHLFHSLSSPIRRDIPPGPATTLTIDLLEETLRYQEQQRKRKPAETEEVPETSR